MRSCINLTSKNRKVTGTVSKMTLSSSATTGESDITRRKRKRYNKKKEKEARALSPRPIVIAAVPFETRENIISQITDLMCRVDWQDYELRNVWTALENLRSLLPAAGKGAGAA